MGTPQRAHAVRQALLGIPGILMMTAAWITFVFAAIELAVTHYHATKCEGLTSDSVDWARPAAA